MRQQLSACISPLMPFVAPITSLVLARNTHKLLDE